jgi:hypothetical protein
MRSVCGVHGVRNVESGNRQQLTLQRLALASSSAKVGRWHWPCIGCVRSVRSVHGVRNRQVLAELTACEVSSMACSATVHAQRSSSSMHGIGWGSPLQESAPAADL